MPSAEQSPRRACQQPIQLALPKLPSSKGLSLAVDPLGHELASGEFYSTDRLAIVAAVPLQARPTLYSRIGDVFAYACLLTLIALTFLGFAHRQHRIAAVPQISQPGLP